jgi:EpsI family protein
VVAVIYAGHVTEMQSFLIRDHYYFGWVIFLLLMVPVFALGRWLETPATGPAVAAQRPPEISRAWVPAAVVLLVALPVLAWWGASTVRPVGHEPVLPPQVGSWAMDGEPAPDWRPLQPGAAVELGGRYVSGDRELDAWVVYYPEQSGGAQLVGYGSGLARPSDGTLSATELGPGEFRLRSPWGTVRLIRYRYEIAGQMTTSRGRAKLLQGIGNLTGRPAAYGLMISARCREPDCGDARSTLEKFESELDATLPAGSGIPAEVGTVRGYE